jgi:2-methylcitrate dehydratase PrpD
MSVTQALADFAASTRVPDLRPEVLTAAKTAILDGIANLAAGSVQPVGVVTRPYINSKGGTPEASVIGQAQRLPTTSAAWLNGVFMHCLDYEIQGYPSAHGTSSILPAALATAERVGSSGAELLLAYAIGWDIQQRLRSAGEKGDLRGFHPPGVVGPLGAVAASGRLLDLTPAQMATAMGLAASRAGGLFANNGTMTKATHPASAARAGVESAELAAAGITANTEIMEDPRGFTAALFGGVFDTAEALDRLGKRWHLTEPGFTIKPYPAEIYMQWPLDAAVQLRAKEPFEPADVVAVEVEPPNFRADLSRPAPSSGLDGKFSYEYCVAVALTQPAVRIASFSDEVRFSAPVEQMLAKITLVENPLTPKDKRTTWSTVRVKLKDGRTLSSRCDRFTGDPTRPMDRTARLAKVHDCLTTGGFSAAAAEDTVALVEDLEHAPDLRGLTRLLRAGNGVRQ